MLHSVTSIKRGTRTERALVLKLLKLGFPPDAIFHDLYLSKVNGNYSQIDVVVVSQIGLLVFEVKNYKGWIYGSGYQRNWTQVLADGRHKYRFITPFFKTKNMCQL